MFAVLMAMFGLCCCSKDGNQSILGRPQLFGPSVTIVNYVEEFHCELLLYPRNEYILLELFKEGNRNKLLGEYTSLNGEVAAFPIIATAFHEGNLECVASGQNNSDIQPTVSRTHYLKVIEPVAGAAIVVQSGPVEFFEGKALEMSCTLTTGNHVSYKWLLNGRLLNQSSLHFITDNHLSIFRTTSADSGSYMCIATNYYNTSKVFTSNSSEVVITIKDEVSEPEIIFTVLKDDSCNYSAVVTCQSTRGTLPVTFSLYNMTEIISNVTVHEREATFKIPLVLGRHLGRLQCQAYNGNRVSYSHWLPLEVEPVGGPVKMHYDYDFGENYAVIGLRFFCKAAKGSHPRYQWFLNKTLLPERGSFYYVVNQPPNQSILMLAVGRSSAGTYHCEVSNSFDNATAISSMKHYLDEEVLNRLPNYVVAVVFGCFSFLVLLVSVCCIVGLVFRRRQCGKKSLLYLEMERNLTAYGNELDLPEYSEDADIVNMARCDVSDQASDSSVDENMLGDEPVTEP